MQGVAAVTDSFPPTVERSSLGIELLNHGCGDLAVIEEALIKGPRHGHFVTAIFYRSTKGATFFFVASQNCSVECFFMPARRVSHLAIIFKNVRKKKVVKERFTKRISLAQPGESKVLLDHKHSKVKFLLVGQFFIIFFVNLKDLVVLIWGSVWFPLNLVPPSRLVRRYKEEPFLPTMNEEGRPRMKAHP